MASGMVAPFFKSGRPQYMQFGSMGLVLGHEITHGFDNEGGEFDATGKHENWWTNQTKHSFNEKAQCFVKQFSNDTYEGSGGKILNVDG
jgi:endothelin-converting enzyme